MYLILVYDVEEKRVAKVCKLLRRYLNWVQNSVFEGEVTDGTLREIKLELKKVVSEKADSVLFYKIDNPKGWNKEIMGQEKSPTDTFL